MMRFFLASTLATLSFGGPVSAQSVRVYLGTYTQAESQGIYLSYLDLVTGDLSEPQLVAEMANPTFLALDAESRTLYAVSEVAKTTSYEGGAVHAYAVDSATGGLAYLNEQPSGGKAPCHVSVSAGGGHVLVANYSSGNVSVYPRDPQTGALQQASAFRQHEGRSAAQNSRQPGPRAHAFQTDATGRWALACDLGLDQVLIYQLDAATGELTPGEPAFAALAPGAGPRHLVFGPGDRTVYVVNELDSTVSVFGWEVERGALTLVQTLSTLPPDAGVERNTTAEIVIHPGGEFLYASNRGHDSLAIYRIDEVSGQLTSVGFAPTQGRQPRSFAFDPSGQYLIAANQNSDNLWVNRFDPATGLLEPVGTPRFLSRPVCVLFVP